MKKEDLVLRKYQEEAINVGAEYFSRKNKQKPSIMVEPVAAGKSLIIGSIAEKMSSPTLVLQPSVELLTQNYAKLLWFGGKATIYSASAGVKEISTTTYATLGSIKKIAKKFKDIGVENVIIDEIHHGYSPKNGSMFRNFMKELNPKRVLGFTATPIRLNTYGTIERTYSQLDFLMKGRKGAPAYFKDIIHLTQIEEMVNNKFWAKLSYEQYDFDESILTLNTTGAEYSEHSISEAIEKNGVNNNIYLRIKSLLKSGHKNILVFVDSIETANKFETLFDNCRAVTGTMNKKNRKEVIDGFKNGDIKIVVNFGTLTTGFDHPFLDTVILGRPTNSFALYYQIVGRVTRNPLYPKQKDALVIDFCNNVKRFGKLENVNFEYIADYGWGMFSDNKLLSNHPMDLPTKTKEDINNEILDSYKDDSDIRLWFGKYRGKRLSEVPVYWSEWAFNNMDFKGKKMLQLKNQITKILIKNGKLKNV